MHVIFKSRLTHLIILSLPMPLCKVAEAVSGITTPQHVTPSTQRNDKEKITISPCEINRPMLFTATVNSLEQNSLPPRDRPDTHTETHDPSYHLNMMLTLHHPPICVVFGPSFVSLPKEKISMKRNKNKRQYVGKCKRPPSAPHLI